MRYSVTAFILLVCVLILSIMVANLAKIVSTDPVLDDKLRKKLESNIRDGHDKRLKISDDDNHLMWFLQISDIHISIFRDKSRVDQLKDFATNTVDIIKPSVVLASGDLTDGKDSDQLGSRQYLEEWNIYKNILETANIKDKTMWLDIRGNHDNFNVPQNSSKNYFAKYSIQGVKHRRSYMQQIKIGDEIYSFIGVDACLETGPKRPFNFIGLLSVNETDLLSKLAAEASNGNFTIWFGHYPTSCILSQSSNSAGFRELIGSHDKSVAYLCGHLHTLGGLLHNMYTLQKEGFLELELGDWKDNRMFVFYVKKDRKFANHRMFRFRIAAFDHGLFSFTDVIFNDWPIILITNPKNILCNSPYNDDTILQRDSTHIRILIFSSEKIVRCQLKIDNGDWFECLPKSRNLYVSKWSPDEFKTGIHSIYCLIKTENGKMKKIQQSFSLDGSQSSFNLLSRITLMMDAPKLFQALFSICLILCIVPLCLFRTFHILVLCGKLKKPRFRNNCLKNIARKFWILSSIDKLVFPIVIYCLYIIFGPWSIGEIIDGHVGVVFAWGIFVDNTFLPGTLTYLYGFFQLAFCQFPIIVILANVTDTQFKIHNKLASRKRGKLSKCLFHFPFALITLVEIMLACTFWMYYGTLAFLIGPFRTWSIALNCVLYYLANSLSADNLKSSTKVWKS